ncbi:hypothetical protein AAC387_Pa08g0628 [Persea americana]
MSTAEEAEVASAMPVDPAPAEPAIAETQPQRPPKRRSPKPQRRRRRSPKKALPILLISRWLATYPVTKQQVNDSSATAI